MSDEDKDVLGEDANAPEISDEEIDTKPPAEGSEPEKAEEPKPEESKPQKERTVWTMPVSKAQEEKRLAVEKAKEEAKLEAEAEIQRLKSEMEALKRNPQDDDYKADLKKVADEHGLDEKAVESLLGVFQKSVKMPDLSPYEQILKEKKLEGEKLQVAKEFDERVVNLIKKDYPNADDKFISDVKDKVSQLAFAKEYSTYRVEDIYKVNRDQFEFKNKMTDEPSGGHSSELMDFEKLSDEDEHTLSERDPNAYRKYVKAMSAKTSRYVD